MVVAAGYLHIHRPKQYADRIRRYQLFVDGIREAEIDAGSEVSIEVAPGRHELRARIDWGLSNVLVMEVGEGERRYVEVGANAAGWRVLLALLYITIWRSRYLYLRDASRSRGEDSYRNPIESQNFWIPGWRQAIVFLLLVLLGLGAWAFRIPAGIHFNPPLLLLDDAFDTGVILYALLALAAGFLVPRGFYLWGVAIVLSHPFAALTLTAYQQSHGADIVRGGVEGWVGYAFVLVAMTMTTAVLTTVLSAAGAGLRLLVAHLRRGRSAPPQDARVR